MNIKNHLEKLVEFQIAFNSTYNTTPKKLTKSQYELRIKLLEEELQELKDAKSQVGIYDALLDMYFLTLGDIVSIGFQDIINQEDLNPEYDTFLIFKDSYMEFFQMEINEFNIDKTLLQQVQSRLGLIELILEYVNSKNLLDIFEEGFYEVFNSNMSKLENGKPIINGIDKIDETRPLGKILKGSDFFEPRLKEILEKCDQK